MFTRRSILLYLAVLLWLPACQAFRQPTPTIPVLSSASTPESTTAAAPDATPASSPTPTAPPLQLTICLEQEPQSLFWYAATSPSERRILAALYDGPFDRLNFNNQPVILEKEPALKDGDAFLEPSTASPGGWIYDAFGERVVLGEGVRYRPSGCLSPDCLTAFSGAEAVEIDQMVVRFRLKSGLVWSDDAPLTADDSLFSYEVARALATAEWQPLLQATHAYQALDDLTLEWHGVPGYLGGSYAEKFFIPLPRHAWGDIPPQELPSAQISARTPLGWGAYQVESWQPGEQIVLHKNPHYYRSAEGLPYFDRLVYRFGVESQAALQALRRGECDWVDPDLLFASQVAELQAAGEVRLILQPADAWEQITLGVARSDEMGSLLAQSEVRRALALCIDRQTVAREALGDLAQVAQGFLPPGHPQALPAEMALPYDPQAGGQLLTAAGWVDLDGDPATPRSAQGVPSQPDGTLLALEYLVSPDADRQAAARQVQADLVGCGVGVTIVTQPFEAYLAPGPEGPVFGRRFQMAQFAWPSAAERLCALYLSGEIPGSYPEVPKGWGGGNASGYSSPAYDRACQATLTALPDSSEKAQALQEAQALFLQDLPAIPLYWRFTLAVARSDLCMPGDKASSENEFWSIESFYRGEACPQE